MNNGFFNWKNIIVGTIAILAIFSGLQMLRAPDRILHDVLVEEEGAGARRGAARSTALHPSGRWTLGKRQGVQ